MLTSDRGITYRYRDWVRGPDLAGTHRGRLRTGGSTRRTTLSRQVPSGDPRCDRRPRDQPTGRHARRRRRSQPRSGAVRRRTRRRDRTLRIGASPLGVGGELQHREPHRFRAGRRRSRSSRLNRTPQCRAHRLQHRGDEGRRRAGRPDRREGHPSTVRLQRRAGGAGRAACARPASDPRRLDPDTKIAPDLGLCLWSRLGSNQRPSACEADALPLSYETGGRGRLARRSPHPRIPSVATAPSSAATRGKHVTPYRIDPCQECSKNASSAGS